MIFSNLIFYFFISIISLIFMGYISRKYELYDIPTKNKIHKVKTPNIAGLSIIILLIFCQIINNYAFKIYIIFNLTIIFVVIGFFDDLKNFSPSKKLFFISIPIIYFCAELSQINFITTVNDKNITLGNFSFMFTFLCIILFVNAINYMDGIDGLISILSIFSLLYIIIFLPYNYWNIIVPIICFLLIFLFFNFGIFEKQFLGNSGSLGLGFILSSYSIYFTQNERIILPSLIIWCLAFYVYEFLTINIIRIKRKKNLFKKDLNFIFNIFQKRYSKTKTIVMCSIIHLFFLFNGIIIYIYNLNNISFLLFTFYFFIYLYFRFLIMKKFIN